MRQTYGQLIQTSKDYTVDDRQSSTNNLSSSESFLKNEINNTVGDLFRLLKNHETKDEPSTLNTTEDQQFYHYPPGMNTIESLTASYGNLQPNLKVVHDQVAWDRINAYTSVTSNVPLYYFPRRYDFGIWPKPSSVYSMTLVGDYIPRRMTVDDYVTGTIAITNNSQTVTGTGTTFTASMVGRFLVETDTASPPNPTGQWYKISGFTSTTEITLQNYYQETTLSGASFIIAETPELPEEIHPYIPYRVAGIYLMTKRNAPIKGQRMLNMYWTGDPLNSKREGRIQGGVLGILRQYREKGRDNSNIVDLQVSNSGYWNPLDERWGDGVTE